MCTYLQRTNVLYALITETIKHADDIDKIFENCSLVAKEPRLDLWLAKVLTAELLFGKKTLPGKSKPEQTILSYKDQFEKYTADHQEDLKTEGNMFLFFRLNSIIPNHPQWRNHLTRVRFSPDRQNWQHWHYLLCFCTVLLCLRCHLSHSLA